MVDIADTHESRTGHLQALRMIVAVIAEYRRAIAAEEHYVELTRKSTTSLAQEGIVRSKIPRRVFEKFYSFTSYGNP